MNLQQSRSIRKMYGSIVGFVFVILSFVEEGHCKKTKHKAIVLLDTLNHLPKSVCNSGHWFRYEDSLDSFDKQEVTSVNLHKGSKGIWLLEHKPFGKITTTSRQPCMEVHSDILMYDQLEIHYFLKGRQSNFSISEYGDTLLSTVSSPSQESGKWDHVRIHQPGLFLRGFKLTANIAEGDFLLIDKVLALPYTVHIKEHKSHAKKV